MNLEEIEKFYSRTADEIIADPKAAKVHEELLAALESGALRAADVANGSWQPNRWVKHAILCGFRRTSVAKVIGPGYPFFDKTGFPPRSFELDDSVRMVPGGTAVRRGAYVAKSVVIMPPAYVNVGAFVDEGTMVDSHALVGSCAQIGRRVHLSAAAQIGGVLEPAGALPVIIEDDAFVGGLCGVFEGVVVRERAVLAPGVLLTASTIIMDLVNDLQISGEVPIGAVVVPGSRPSRTPGIQLYAPCIVKYRDSKTDAATALEEALR